MVAYLAWWSEVVDPFSGPVRRWCDIAAGRQSAQADFVWLLLRFLQSLVRDFVPMRTARA
jgi:hypothetical protein